MTAKTRLVIGFKDDIGLERDNMEDAAGYSNTTTNMDVRRKGSIFVVADGVGGQQAGEVASRKAVSTILKEYYTCPYDDTETSLRYAINQANDGIFKEAQETGRDTMATTVVCAVIRDGVLTLANLGDSRIYLLRDGKIRQLTEDHSWVNEQIRSGLLTPQEAKASPFRNVITKSLGNKPKVDPTIETPGSLLDNDLIILCSDGMYEGVSEQDMIEVTRRLPSIQAAEEFVEMAKRGGSTDNITVMIVEAHVSGDSETSPVSMDVQKSASAEPDTQPNIASDIIEQQVQPVEKPLDPPATTIADAPAFSNTLEDDVSQGGKKDNDREKVSHPVITLRPIPHQAASMAVQATPISNPESTQPGLGQTGSSQPPALRRPRLSGEESQVGLMETNASIRRFYWDGLFEFNATGEVKPFQQEKIVKLPDGTEVTLALKILMDHFTNALMKKTYSNPFAFEISAKLHRGEKNLIKSKVVMGAGFYNFVKEKTILSEFSKKKFELLISEDEIFLINKTNPLIFATIEIVEFENMRDHNVDQDFLTFTQLKVRFHIIY